MMNQIFLLLLLYACTSLSLGVAKAEAIDRSQQTAFKKLYDFSSSSKVPEGTIVFYDDTIFGIITDESQGNVFAFNLTEGRYQNVLDFAPASELGYLPQCGLVLGSNGTLYGATSAGGKNGLGVMYELGQDQDCWVRHNFKKGEDVDTQYMISVQGGTVLYGITEPQLFTSDCSGYAVFQYDVNSTNFRQVFCFDGISSKGLTSPLMLVSGVDDGLYGITESAVFSFDLSDENLIVLAVAFPPNSPIGFGVNSLVTADDGFLYGTAGSGGGESGEGKGLIFRGPSQGGQFSSFYTFDGGMDGGSPCCLTLAEDGKLYGLTSGGGKYGLGTIFMALLASRNVTTIYHFDNNDGTKRLALLSLGNNTVAGTTDKLLFMLRE